MFANYHTHTWRCKHADENEREYVEQALAAGIRILGFSDHTPYPFPNGYVSYFRMAPGQAEDYFTTLSDLKREYAGQIDIRIGVEAEYYPERFQGLLDFLRDYPCEYMLMGQHYIHNETDGVYSGNATADEAVLVQYVSQVLEGLETGLFTYVAHPDLIHWQGPEEIGRRELTRLCRGVKALEIPLEINLLGLMKHRHYPSDLFWQIAGEVGCTGILGCDAHQAWALNLPEIEQQGRDLAARYGIPLLDTAALKPISRK